MRILLDTRDLIDLIERESPCTLEICNGKLRSRGATVVLTPSHLQELAAPLELASSDSVVTRTLINLERLPLSYANETKIPRLELKEAIRAFRTGSDVASLDPYVERLDAAVPLIGASPTRHFLHYSLAEIAFDLWQNRPDVLRKGPTLASGLRAAVENRRSRGSGGGDLTEFTRSLPDLALRVGLDFGDLNVPEFAGWVWSASNRCPGVSLWFKVRHEVMRNMTDKIQDSDIIDLSWMWLLPYVDIATLDRRMKSYVQRAMQRDRSTICGIIVASLSEVLRVLEGQEVSSGSSELFAGAGPNVTT